MDFKCACGKSLRVADNQAGKSVKCPACGRVVKASPGGKTTLRCECGKTLAVPANAAGKQVRCPACKKLLFVPGAAGGAGEAEEDDNEQYAVARPKCPHCNTELPDSGALFCVECGTNLRSGERVGDVVIERAPKKSPGKKAAVIAICVLAVAALVGGGVYVVTHYVMKPEGPKPPPAERAAAMPQTPASPAPSAAPPAATEPVTTQSGTISTIQGPDVQRGKLGPAPKKTGNEGYLEQTVYAPSRAQDKVTLIEVQRAIQAFEAVEGRLPKNLDELKQSYPFPAPPPGMVYVYDSATGKVESHRARDLPATP